MKATLAFVPPGGGEADYYLEFELPGVPQLGDYISIARSGQQGTEDFIVRRTWWYLEPGQHIERKRRACTNRHDATGHCWMRVRPKPVFLGESPPGVRRVRQQRASGQELR